MKTVAATAVFSQRSYKTRRRLYNKPLAITLFILVILFLISKSSSETSESQENKLESSTSTKPKIKTKTKVKTKSKKEKASSENSPDKCFCELSNKLIHDTNCLCDVHQLINFNNEKILPVMKKLILTDYFRYFKANINKGCEYWDEPYVCTTNQCGMQHCNPTELPPILAEDSMRVPEQTRQTQKDIPTACKESRIITSQLSNIGETQDSSSSSHTPSTSSSNDNLNASDDPPEMTEKEVEKMQKHWDLHDKKRIEHDIQNKKIWQRSFCELDEESEDKKYYDLLRNPERFTGYAGPPAHKIWRKIYEENCYAEKEVSSLQDAFGLAGLPFGQAAGHLFDENKDTNWWRQPNEVIKELECVEKRVFFRAVSGLHSSISLHLSYIYFFQEENEFRPNLEEFIKRFENENGSIYLENLYFVWLLELRALAKATAYLTNPNNIRGIIHTGDVLSDIKTQSAIIELTESIKSFDVHFDESHLFRGHNAEEMMEDFRKRMFTVTKIVDCADCEKCRLWGKLQTTGLATAVKIILTPIECLEKNISIVDKDNVNRDSDEDVEACENFMMTRGEIVALFNAFARLSHSVSYVEDFKYMLKEKKRRAREEL